MPFAGHPKLGNCAAWLHKSGQPQSAFAVKQQCEIGMVHVDTSGEILAFVAPMTKISAVPDADVKRLITAMDIPPGAVVNSAGLDNGSVWQLLELASAEDVLAIDSSTVAWPEFSGVSVVAKYPAGGPADYEVRNLSPASGMSEDPTTGSLNAVIAHWLRSQGRLTAPITIAQGRKINRNGRVHIQPDPNDPSQILIGGETRIVIDGSVSL